MQVETVCFIYTSSIYFRGNANTSQNLLSSSTIWFLTQLIEKLEATGIKPEKMADFLSLKCLGIITSERAIVLLDSVFSSSSTASAGCSGPQLHCCFHWLLLPLSGSVYRHADLAKFSSFPCLKVCRLPQQNICSLKTNMQFLAASECSYTQNSCRS